MVPPITGIGTGVVISQVGLAWLTVPDKARLQAAEISKETV